MLFLKILKKKYFNNCKNIVELYEFKKYIAKMYDYSDKKPHSEVMDPDAYIPITLISVVLSLVTLLISSYLSLIIISLYFTFVIFIQLYLLRDIIKNGFLKFITNIKINSFENKYIYNHNNFIKLMHEIDFDTLTDYQKNSIINNISNKNFDQNDVATIYNLIIKTNNNMLQKKITNFNDEKSGKNVNFFTKNKSS